MLGTDDGILFRFTNGELIGSILRVADWITLNVDEGNEVGSPDVSFDGFNDVIPENSLLGDSLVTVDRPEIGSFDASIDGVLEDSAL